MLIVRAARQLKGSLVLFHLTEGEECEGASETAPRSRADESGIPNLPDLRVRRHTAAVFHGCADCRDDSQPNQPRRRSLERYDDQCRKTHVDIFRSVLRRDVWSRVAAACDDAAAMIRTGLPLHSPCPKRHGFCATRM